jgi:hypothetical protein
MNVASVGIDLLENSLETLNVTDPEALERITDVKGECCVMFMCSSRLGITVIVSRCHQHLD